jgi:hypothetical protein
MLESGSLFFSQVASLQDKFEGSYPGSYPPAIKPPSSESPLPPHVVARFIELGDVQADILRRHTYVNCWCMWEHESVALWRMYGRTDGHGIALKSTYRRLRIAIADGRVRIGGVQYLDYAKDSIRRDLALRPFLRKRTSYEFEREWRAVLVDVEGLRRASASSGTETSAFGLDVPAAFATLVSEIRVAPDCAPWFRRLVESVVRKYGFDTPVLDSALSGVPMPLGNTPPFAASVGL